MILAVFIGFTIIGFLPPPAQGDVGADRLRVFRAFSPNFDDRPPNVGVDTVVLHATSAPTWEAVVDIFSSARTRVSAHYTIARDGRIITHVRENERAWHAGESRMPDGREDVNDFSIGIELVNRNDGSDPYPREQLDALRALLARLYDRYPIRYLVAHAEIALPPGRKSDPAGLDFGSLPRPRSRHLPAGARHRLVYRPMAVGMWIAAGILLLVAIETCRRNYRS